MSLTTTLTIGTALGGAAAVAIYTAVAPAAPPQASSTQPVSVQAVPTPTRTVLAPCVRPAVLTKGACVTHVPGPIIVAAAPASTSGSSSARPTTRSTSAPAPTTEPGDTYGDESEHDHGGDGPGDD